MLSVRVLMCVCTVSISGCSIEDDGVRALVCALKENSKLRSVDLSGTRSECVRQCFH